LQETPKVAAPSSSAQSTLPVPNLMELDARPATEEFTSFQGAQDGFSSPAKQPTSKDFDNAFSFFGDPSSQASAAPQPLSKQTILELYNSPMNQKQAPTMMGSSSPTTTSKANYNVVLDPVYPGPAPAPMMRYQNPTMVQYVQPGMMAQPMYTQPAVYSTPMPGAYQPVGYQNGGMYQPTGVPMSTGVGYVNPNHLKTNSPTVARYG